MITKCSNLEKNVYHHEWTFWVENYTLDLEILDGEHPLGGDQVRTRTQNMAY